MRIFTKEFEVYEGSTESTWYQILVYFGGKIVDSFTAPTMREAKSQFERAGYKPKQ